MKTKVLATIVFLCIFSTSFGQDYKNNFSSVNSIDDQIQEKHYTTDEIPLADRLLLRIPIKNISYRDKKFYSKKEWKKIKKQLLKNKQRISEQNSIHSSRTLDTIYLDIPTQREKSRLSGW